MKSLFNEDKSESWTPEAIELDRMVTNALRPIYNYAKSKGYSMRDVATIIDSSSIDMSFQILLDCNDKPEKSV